MLRWATPALVVALLVMGAMPASAESNEDVPLRFSYVEGKDNLPPGCPAFKKRPHDGPVNPCHAIATSMNGLDSPVVDVLILVPASPFAERDIRILRQSTQMWEDGLKWTAADMGLGWLAEGIEFRISTQMIDDPGTFTGYAVLDPEIVVVASNPVGGLGIGIDPIDFSGRILEIFGVDGVGEGPCHGVKQPFLMEAWLALPGFDAHHGERSGTYVEDCDGAGGNICFSVNASIDPYTEAFDFFQLYDLVSHETGHCLTLGHVGDGAEGSWDSVPTNDIMAYHSDPIARSKCVSTLNVEGFAVSMSKYLDRNGDGTVDAADRVWANDAEGEGDGRPFMMQQPGNHYYASPTREAKDCPQPDMTFMPQSEVRDFTPDAAPRSFLQIDALVDGTPVAQGLVPITGRVAGEIPAHILERPLPAPAVNVEDPAGDAKVAHFDILAVDANVTDEALEVVVRYADLRPDGGKNAQLMYALDVGSTTFTATETSPYAKWDLEAKTITFRMLRDDLAANRSVVAPYGIRAWTYVLNAHGSANFDYAPPLSEPAVLVGPIVEPKGAPYVSVQTGRQNLTVPIGADGTWSAVVDLSVFDADRSVNVTATWMSAAGHAVDSDHLLVIPDPAVPSSVPAVDEDVPGPTGLLVVLSLALLASVVRRRRDRP